MPWGSGLQLISKSNVGGLKQVAQLKGLFGPDSIQWAWLPDHSPLLAVQTWPVHALVKPASEGLFAGALDISKIPSFGDRLKFR